MDFNLKGQHWHWGPYALDQVRARHCLLHLLLGGSRYAGGGESRSTTQLSFRLKPACATASLQPLSSSSCTQARHQAHAIRR